MLFWGSADQPLDVTSKDDVAAYTAAVALDDDAPRWLQVAGDTVTARSLAATMADLTGRPFRLTFAGPIPLLRLMARVGRAVGDEDELYPVWQGMQYVDSMSSGDGTLLGDDRDRYGRRSWTTAREVLAAAG